MFRSTSYSDDSWLSQIRRVCRYNRTGVPRIIQSGSEGQTGFCYVCLVSLRRTISDPELGTVLYKILKEKLLGFGLGLSRFIAKYIPGPGYFR
jgi:hypothetical protein